MGTVEWGRDIAEVYDDTSAAMFDPAVLDPAVDRLAELAAGGRALELAIGTGRVTLPLQERGVELHGIELSSPMVERLRSKPGGADLPVVIGDMASARAEGTFAFVYLVWNSLMNLTTQEEQVRVFENAAAHLEAGGCFVVELIVPQLRRVPHGERGHVFQMDPDHVGIETFEDTASQIAWSHHWMQSGDRLVHHSAAYRYVWPAELDLMARLAGLRLRHRWSDWHRAPFAPDSQQHISVYEPPP